MGRRDTNRESREEGMAAGTKGEERTFVRKKLGQRANVLSAPKIPGYHVHIINEENVPIKMEQGYRFLESDYKVGDGTVNTCESTGSAMTRDVGGGKTGYVMILSDEWREEDNEVRRSRVLLQTQEPLEKLNSDAFYGKVSNK